MNHTSSKNPQIQKLLEKCHELLAYKEIVLCWIPSHIGIQGNEIVDQQAKASLSLYPPQTLFVGGILFSRCPSVRACIRPSVTLCFLNNLSHCWIFIKPCKHVHICKTNTFDKKVRARGQFY